MLLFRYQTICANAIATLTNPRKTSVRSRLSKEVWLLCVWGYFPRVHAIAYGSDPRHLRNVGDLTFTSSNYKTVI
ncbi:MULTISPECIES: hypothetical protein [Cyanophyceae]|uniref:hypothetical protein n=1 Tax=Cyanophyceae TaxID=3028117 RepID=UPI0016829102|nr:hypothetical protein [Trichocoleus sp. FACHB-69]MBD1930468.1 hypothetical protein [Trichocoleus sp. FACHB-69]